MPRLHHDRHDPRARPRVRRHRRRPRLSRQFRRLHRQDRRHRILYGRWLRAASTPAMVTTPPPSTTVSSPATSTKRWPVPARSWPATVAATRRYRGAASRLDAALDKARVTHDVKEYPDASHAFLNDAEAGPRALRPLLRVAGIGPEPDSAKDAWNRIEHSSPPTYTDRAPINVTGQAAQRVRPMSATACQARRALGSRHGWRRPADARPGPWRCRRGCRRRPGRR